MKHLILVVKSFNVFDEISSTCCHVVANLALEPLPVDCLHVKIEASVTFMKLIFLFQ